MKKILLLLMCACSGTAYAQENSTNERWSLNEAIEYAWKNNIQVEQSQLQIQTTEVEYMQAKLGRLPSLNAQAQHGYAFGRSIDPFSNQFTTEPIRFNNFSLFSSVDIFGGFQIHNRIKARYAALEGARSDANSAKNLVALQVTNAYLQVLLNQELAAIASLQTVTSREQVDRTRIQVEAGALSQSNLLDVESQLATDELAVVNAENNLEIARLNLLQALQLPGDQKVEVEPIDPDMTGMELTTTTSQEIFAIAMENQPEIQAARHRQLSSQYSVRAARSALYPTLTLSGNITTQYSSIGVDQISLDTEETRPIGFVENGGVKQPVFANFPAMSVRSIPFMDQLDLNRRENVSLSLNIPIFNNMTSRSQVSLARIQSRTAELELARELNTLRTTIEQSYTDARTAVKRYAALQKQVEAMELAFRNAETRRDVGSISAYDYIFAKNNLDRARAELSQAKYTYIFRLKVLDFYLGNPLSLEKP